MEYCSGTQISHDTYWGDNVNVYVTLLLILGVLVLMAWFVQKKAKQSGGFGRWLWQIVFIAVSIFLVYMVFLLFVPIENWVVKLLFQFIAMGIATPTAARIGGMLYDRK